MAGNANQKLKLLYLLKFFYQETDENNPATMQDILAYLKQHGILAERKSIYADIALLNEFGIEILKTGGKFASYYLAQREFELPELKLLVDTIQSARFITVKKSNELIHKIESLTSRHQAGQLQRQVYVAERIKALNEKIYYHVDKLHRAILENKMVSFLYFEYTVEKKKQYRNNGQRYKVSPYFLSWAEDNYYLVAYYESHGKTLTHFRVDRMDDIILLEEHHIPIEEITGKKELNIANYSKGIFNMFSGKREKVRLLFENSLVSVVIDRFGEDVFMRREDDKHFIAVIEVVVSQTFFAWLFQFGARVKILSPKYLQQEMKEMVNKIAEQY